MKLDERHEALCQLVFPHLEGVVLSFKVWFWVRALIAVSIYLDPEFVDVTFPATMRNHANATVRH